VAHHDEGSGREYFYNPISGVTSWTRPLSPNPPVTLLSDDENAAESTLL
jgi:hypothetical protein